jgi:hypothetical protein
LEKIDTNNVVFLRIIRTLLSKLYCKELNKLKDNFKILGDAPVLLDRVKK